LHSHLESRWPQVTTHHSCAALIQCIQYSCSLSSKTCGHLLSLAPPPTNVHPSSMPHTFTLHWATLPHFRGEWPGDKATYTPTSPTPNCTSHTPIPLPTHIYPTLSPPTPAHAPPPSSLVPGPHGRRKKCFLSSHTAWERGCPSSHASHMHLPHSSSHTYIPHTSDGNLYIADSESSSIRAVAMATGSAKAVVGGAIDPQVSVVKLKERRRGEGVPTTHMATLCVCVL